MKFMKYKDLQHKAKTMGLKYVGVSKKRLKEMIEETEGSEMVVNETPEIENKIFKENKTPPQKIEEKKVFNAAVIYNKFQEIRTYSLDVHGKNFAELAKEFANAREYTVKFIQLKPSIICPNCGGTFHN